MKKLIALLTGRDYFAAYDCFKHIKPKENWVESVTLKFSTLDSQWSKPGKIAYTSEDTGNGIVIKSNKGEVISELTYSDSEAVRLILKIHDENRTNLTFLKESKL